MRKKKDPVTRIHETIQRITLEGPKLGVQAAVDDIKPGGGWGIVWSYYRTDGKTCIMILEKTTRQ